MRAVIDAKVVPETGEIIDFGAIRSSGKSMHDASLKVVRRFLQEFDFLCYYSVL